jgi:hypothetical protein
MDQEHINKEKERQDAVKKQKNPDKGNFSELEIDDEKPIDIKKLSRK